MRSYRHQCPVCLRGVGSFLPLSRVLPGLMADLKKHQFDMQLFARAETLNMLQYACPWCRANDRTRLYAIFLREEAKRIGNAGRYRMLDIAPAKTLQPLIHSLGCFDYRSCDLLRSDVDDRVDITDMHAYADAAFNCFICSHVLEHVPDNRRGMRELHRILKPGGWGIVMVPIALGLQASVEDPTLSDPAERVRRFGQSDHLRLYARYDFLERLTSAGFAVSQLGLAHFGEQDFTKYGIAQSSVLYICRRV
jgi:SAM-dependent methyltransferase